MEQSRQEHNKKIASVRTLPYPVRVGPEAMTFAVQLLGVVRPPYGASNNREKSADAMLFLAACLTVATSLPGIVL